MPKHPPAASILYAIVITTVIIVTAGTMSASFIRASQRNHDLYRSTQAYYAARAAMEEGIAASATANELGFEASNTTAINWAPVNATGEYQVFSRSKGLNWRNTPYNEPSGGSCGVNNPENCFIMPIPGTGTAGGTDCDVNNPNQPWSTIINNDCNWNKIEYQETVSIPLYYEDVTDCPSDGVCNPAETQLTNFVLRVRVPDFDGNGAPDFLDGDDQVIVNWEISGDCDTDGNGSADETCYMVADPGIAPTYSLNTQIQATNINPDHSINAGDPYEVLTVNFPNPNVKGMTNMISTGPFRIDFFLRETTPFEILNPVLKLSVISPLTNSLTSSRIPNLEYQILTDTPISDNKIIYMAEGSAEGRLGTYVRNIRASQGLESNALINFVIQN